MRESTNTAAVATMTALLIALMVYEVIASPWWSAFVAVPLLALLTFITVPDEQRREPRHLILFGVLIGLTIWSVMMLASGPPPWM